VAPLNRGGGGEVNNGTGIESSPRPRLKTNSWERIIVDPMILDGEPIIRGMRIAVEHVLRMLAAGDTPQRQLEE
jgi:uncharacterized protein (DUF433 family)